MQNIKGTIKSIGSSLMMSTNSAAGTIHRLDYIEFYNGSRIKSVFVDDYMRNQLSNGVTVELSLVGVDKSLVIGAAKIQGDTVVKSEIEFSTLRLRSWTLGTGLIVPFGGIAAVFGYTSDNPLFLLLGIAACLLPTFLYIQHSSKYDQSKAFFDNRQAA